MSRVAAQIDRSVSTTNGMYLKCECVSSEIGNDQPAGETNERLIIECLEQKQQILLTHFNLILKTEKLDIW